ncbi:MAG: hypothetical protein ACKOQ8_05615 [Micrococcales bacterium]
MGDRSVIQINSDSFAYPISLYGHWAGEDNLRAVKIVLDQPEARVGDASYLTAQLFFWFSTALGGYDGELGYGIDTGSHDPDWLDNPIVYINADTGDYTYEGITYNRNHEVIKETTND